MGATRRDLVHLATAATIIGITTQLITSSAEATAADPIFAAIERMETAELEYLAAVQEESDAEETIPKDRRQSDDCLPGELLIDPNDDPRWIAAVRRMRAAMDAVDDRSIDLLKIQPTTFAGVVALLRYAYTYVAHERREWTQYVQEDDPRRYKITSGDGLDFSVVLHRHVADAIEAIAARGRVGTTPADAPLLQLGCSTTHS